MPNETVANITFIGVERKDTRNGKERYVARTSDGREFGIWDRPVAEALKAHLHEDLACEVSSRQDDRGTWWHNLHALPSLGIARVPRQTNGSGGGQAQASGGSSVDIEPLVNAANRIALVMENLLAFVTEAYLADNHKMVQAQPAATWPNDDPPEEPPL